MDKIAILYITENGRALAERLKGWAPEAHILKFSSAVVPKLWKEFDAFVFIMASGIVVRTIAPMLKDKKFDPGVVVLDESGKYAISLVSGHLGGANELAREIAAFLQGEAVITTASDVNNLTSIDIWARDNNLMIENWPLLPQIGTRFVNNGALRVYSDVQLEFPDDFLRVADPRFADVMITNRSDLYSASGDSCSTGSCRVKGQLYLRPVNLVLGIGCNSATSHQEIEDAVRQTLEENNLAFSSIRSIATIDIKGSEPGLIAFAGKFDFPVDTFTAGELNGVENVEKSESVFKATGAYAVAEPSAMLSAKTDALLVRKQKKGNVTVAVSEMRNAECGMRNEKEKGIRQGKIYVVGTGPGRLDYITPAAKVAIAESDVIVGYGTYLELIEELIKDKNVVSTGMTQEVDRCRKAVELAVAGKTVSVISGGDPGVYAMAGLVFEVLRNADPDERNNSEFRIPHSELKVEVIPGISALNACAARLGAPLMHDFACISLSDRLTPWDMIEKRLEAAAAADFVIVLYNPRSKGRADHINRAREIILKHRQPSTVAGIVKGAMRENEKIIVTDLANMNDADIDMQTTVIIGNSKTFVWNNLMVTPRGYESKFKL